MMDSSWDFVNMTLVSVNLPPEHNAREIWANINTWSWNESILKTFAKLQLERVSYRRCSVYDPPGPWGYSIQLSRFWIKLQMARIQRLLGHIRGNFTHVTTMIHIFDADVSIDKSTWIFISWLRLWSAREGARRVMINISLGSQSPRKSTWDEKWSLLACQEAKSTWILAFPVGFHDFPYISRVLKCNIPKESEFPRDF